VLTVGLTGGIGSGKSAVARLLAERGAVVVDADRLAREALGPGMPGLAAVVEEFGPGVLHPDGTLDRPALGRLVFADAARRAALEAIVHPYVGRRSAELRAAAPPDAVVVHDVPLLVENHLESGFDLVVVVEAGEDVRLARLADSRGMPAEEARSRMAAQASDDQRRAVADVLLANDGDLDDLARQVGTLWERLARDAAGA
jgi:dephospho-CoA kinase